MIVLNPKEILRVAASSCVTFLRFNRIILTALFKSAPARTCRVDFRAPFGATDALRAGDGVSHAQRL